MRKLIHLGCEINFLESIEILIEMNTLAKRSFTCTINISPAITTPILINWLSTSFSLRNSLAYRHVKKVAEDPIVATSPNGI